MNLQKKILLVEDDPLLAMLEKKHLENYGYLVEIANTGEEAVSYALDSNKAFDLILMDIDLGVGIDGTLVATAILKQKDIPILFLSSHTEPEIVSKTEKITSYGYVVKDSGMIVLDASIKMAFKLFDAKIKAKKNEKQYRLLFENMTNGFALHQMIYDENNNPIDYQFLDMNPAFEKITGLKVQSVLGKRVKEVLPNVENHWIETYGKVAQSQIPLVYENYSQELQKYFEVLAFSPSLGQFAVIVSDTTKNKEKERLLQETQNRYKQILENTGAGYFYVDEQGYFKDVNPAMLQIHHYTQKEEMVNKHFSLITNPQEIEKIREAIKEMIDQKRTLYWGEFTKKEPNDTYKNYIFTINAVKKEDQFAGVEGFIFNSFQTSTQIEKQMKEQIKEQNWKKQLEEKDLLLREVHHRIKNTLHSLLSMVSIRIAEPIHPQAKAILLDTLGALESISKLYQNLNLKDPNQEIFVKPYFESLMQSILQINGKENIISFSFQTQESLLTIKNLMPLGIIFNELITNAIKYAFLNLPNQKNHIAIKLNQKEGDFILEVHDNGQGLPDNFQLEKNQGFGLMLVSMLTQQLKGSFLIENQNGVKATAIIKKQG